MPAREHTQLVFDGEPNKRQKFALVSFPGQYEAEWDQITRQGRVPKEQRLASSCVFYPNECSDYYGEHCRPCQCENLYRGVHKDYDSWPNGQAEFGCFWFQRWKNNVKFTEGRQVAIIVYKAGLVNKTEGLGNSQRGEVAEIHKRSLPNLHVDIDEFMQHILPVARSPQTLDGKSLDEVKDFLGCLIEGKRVLRLEAIKAELQVCLNKERQLQQQKAADVAEAAEQVRRCQEKLSESERLTKQLQEAFDTQPPLERWAELKKDLERQGLLLLRKPSVSSCSSRRWAEQKAPASMSSWPLALCAFVFVFVFVSVVCLGLFVVGDLRQQVKQLQEALDARPLPGTLRAEVEVGVEAEAEGALHACPPPATATATATVTVTVHEQEIKRLQEALHARPLPEEWATAQEQLLQLRESEQQAKQQTKQQTKQLKQLQEALHARPSPEQWAEAQEQVKQLRESGQQPKQSGQQPKQSQPCLALQQGTDSAGQPTEPTEPTEQPADAWSLAGLILMILKPLAMLGSVLWSLLTVAWRTLWSLAFTALGTALGILCLLALLVLLCACAFTPTH